ncbi:peptide chain release factor 2 [Rhodoblastus acidophilus]|uniref:Peptide chain release factor 2 n=1 Tax=Candidatus Rhodoblastus alkanivorans TaxID=2954117 RepID=A0ABS9Z8E2_9HYPH|nr:peptide chain release factor 2 [Candidatus Rhodoblastus alkanivorans]MCI4679560.1 peptide chain release factor 2 [Candidatus Rhodoblastus alkanivorans]MCI4683311.1 peptide chain release factor 2 [Candidatus Rhodoblastus alkanivorans]MDI4640624.1 peptide chain release factor 2 [Rhodoblastus acidophilus]
MRAEAVSLVEQIKQSVGLLRRHLDVETSTRRLAELNAKSEEPDFWNDAETAQKLMRERTELEDRLGSLARFESELEDAITLVELGEMEGDTAAEQEGLDQLKAIKTEADRRQVEALLSGEADANDTFIEVHSGAGGTESCDWARMLLRMYTRWAERHKFKVELIEETAGDEAGIKSATILVKGHNAHGWAKTESGVHRLVRISPFDSNARRHTSFASAWIYPVIDDKIDIQINEADCRIDTYRSSGAGGQHVNTTDSAIRITHIPSGIVVACQMERSQHKNRATAWNMLRARLYEQELERREAEANKINATKSEIGWGHQIRSYVLQPYQMVKDLRTGVVSGTPDEVLDGDLDAFMEAALAQRVHGGGPEKVEDVE